MKLRKIVLGLATMTLLASCAKDVTKEEAVKIAKEHYDASNQVYKSGHAKVVTEVVYSDNVPEVAKTQKGGTEEADFTDPEEMADYRMNSAQIAACPDDAKFKADGAKLQISYSQTQSLAGSTVNIDATVNLDEIGYVLSSVSTMKTSVLVSEGVTYEITVKANMTITWTK